MIQSLEGAADPSTPRSRAHSASPAATEKVRELAKSMQQEGADSKRTLDKMKSIGGKSLSRGLENVSCTSNSGRSEQQLLLCQLPLQM